MVDEGMSCRAAAQRFGVAAAMVIRWHDQRCNTGSYAAKPQDGDMRSRRIDALRTRLKRCTRLGATSHWMSCAASRAKRV